jgi:hypothetical protein
MRIPIYTERKTMKVIGTCKRMRPRRRITKERSLQMEGGLSELSRTNRRNKWDGLMGM